MKHAHDHTNRVGSRRALRLVLALTVVYTGAEIVGGLLTGSLALLADAGHMLGDSAALALALGAAWLATRPRLRSGASASGEPRSLPRSRTASRWSRSRSGCSWKRSADSMIRRTSSAAGCSSSGRSGSA